MSRRASRIFSLAQNTNRSRASDNSDRESESEIDSFSDESDEDFTLVMEESDDDIESINSDENVEENNDINRFVGYVNVDLPEQPPVLPHQFMELPGPKHMPNRDSPPLAYFYLLFTVNLLDLMVKETNRAADQYMQRNAGRLAERYKKWKNVTIVEMKAFLACIINMGLNKKPTIRAYWSTKSSQVTPWFNKMFPLVRFEMLMKFFHLVNSEACPAPGHPDYDPCLRYQPLVDHANHVFRHHYTPHEQISIDESLVGTKCHTSLLQYLPNKHHHRWGVKFWMLCDSVSNYCLGFFTYKGARNQEDKDIIRTNGLGYYVVTKLLEMGNYLNKGYHLFVDNFFMSVPIMRFLFTVSTYMTGTVRRNRKHLPPQFKKKFAVGEKMYCRSGPVLACAYREKQSQRAPVLLLSSKVPAGDIEVAVRRRRGEVIQKPEVIHQYNKYMGGIDTSDMMLYTYLDERRTLRYWKKVAFNIIGRMMLNGYILYKEHYKAQGGQKIMSRYSFIVEIIEAISKEWLETKDVPDDPAGPSGIRKLPEKKESRCCVCTAEGKKRRSRTVCNRCNKGLHGECFPKHKC